MAHLNIAALSCGTCHQSGIAAWRSADAARCEVVFVSAIFVHDAGASRETPAFRCAVCKAAALTALLK